MIDSQLRTSGVSGRLLLSALAEVPREFFVVEGRRAVAYVDDVQPLGVDNRFLLSPAHFGRMVQLASIAAEDRVLDVGAGSGYSTAVLARIAREVVGVEVDAALAGEAREKLAALGYGNANIVDGLEAVAGQQFDAIIVEGAMDGEPQELTDLLAPGGRLVVPLVRRGVAVIHVFVRKTDGVMFTSEFDATMPRLWGSAPKDEFVF